MYIWSYFGNWPGGRLWKLSSRSIHRWESPCRVTGVRRRESSQQRFRCGPGDRLPGNLRRYLRMEIVYVPLRFGTEYPVLTIRKAGGVKRLSSRQIPIHL
ncbi:hypothetical protein EVAR_6037_1 [Eumeta japonica]|uniref:Uncharacterized protein n=1 Tax=Eumeta variegata TaxID=151549 RepID=A0A4C1TCP1_EUMVA|nr:hypothetical protein EVAR_6037_1 [Eumeta japonica]